MAAKRSRWEDSRRFCDPEKVEEVQEETAADTSVQPESSPESSSPGERTSESEGESSEEDGSPGPAQTERPEKGASRAKEERGVESDEEKRSEGEDGKQEAPKADGERRTPLVAEQAPAGASEQAGGPGVNLFANDGSFLELFKRKMEAVQSPEEQANPAATSPPEEQEKKRPSAFSFVGKRRGGTKLALKTGIVAKKQKAEDEISSSKGGAWAQYMAEVKKYKAHQCSDDDKTRPLVK